MNAIDLGRLRRAVHLDAAHLPSGDWKVRGGKSEHTVSPDGSACDCMDFGARQTVCKHRLAVLLAGLDADVLAGLRALLPAG